MAVFSLRLFSIFSHLLFIVILTSQASANESSPTWHHFCDQHNDRGNYTTNSTYHTNLNTLLSTLTSNTEINYGFYNFSYGENTDKVNAIGLCRGDVKPDKCRSCLNNSRLLLTQSCPNRKEAIGWHDDEKCMLRYSDRSIFGVNEIGPAYFVWNMNNATEMKQFNKAVKTLLDDIKRKAASGDSKRKYAVSSVVGPDHKPIYGLVQCTPDLSASLCDNCLNQSIAEIPICCDARLGARIVRPSCYLRFETSSLFYEPSAKSPALSPLSSTTPMLPPSLSSSPNSTNSEDKGNSSRTVVSTIPLLLLLCAYLFVSI